MGSMILRPPNIFAVKTHVQTGAQVLDEEILAEQASALGRAGEAVEKALKVLRETTAEGEERRVLVDAAAEKVYGFLIQRELCGLRDRREVIRSYGIPGEVLARLGATPSRK